MRPTHSSHNITAIVHIHRELQAANAHGGVVLVFTSSLDSTHRLCRLLQLHGLLTNAKPTGGGPSGGQTGQTGVHEFSSSLSQPQRAELIRRAKAATTANQQRGGGEPEAPVRVLVSSDGMARGIDLPNVAAVINYDVPTQVCVYVCGCWWVWVVRV